MAKFGDDLQIHATHSGVSVGRFLLPFRLVYGTNKIDLNRLRIHSASTVNHQQHEVGLLSDCSNSGCIPEIQAGGKCR